MKREPLKKAQRDRLNGAPPPPKEAWELRAVKSGERRTSTAWYLRPAVGLEPT